MNQTPFYVTGIALSQFILGAEALGLDARTVLSNAGLNEEHLVPTAQVPETQYEMLLVQLALASNNDSMGADIGQQIMPSLYGVLTSMLLNSSSVAEGLKNFIDYQALATGNCGGIDTQVLEETATFTFTMTHRNTIARKMVTECVITLFCDLLKLISGHRELIPQAICIEHSPSSQQSQQHIQSLLGCPITWNAGKTSIDIDIATYQLPIHGQGEEMLQLARKLASKQLASFEKHSSQTESIKWHTRDLMQSGSPTRESVADRLGISTSTLDRRLKEADLTWQTMVDNLRAQLATEALRNTSNTIASIAEKLGFSDTRAFQRRFKIWTGMTPTDYRNSQKDR